MMRFIVASLLAVLLVGCGMMPQQTRDMPGAVVGSEIIDSFAVATLAPVGTFEWRAAPAYTQLAVLVHKTEKKLRAGEITVAEAVEVHQSATGIRKRLNDAVKLDADGKTDAANKFLMAAGVQILALQNALNTSQVQP